MADPSEQLSLRAARSAVLVMRQVSFTYQAETHPALQDISLEIPAGGATAIIGRLGAGCSTLLRLASGLGDNYGHLTGSIQHHDVPGPAGESAVPAALLGDDPDAQLTGLASVVVDEVRLPGRLTGLGVAEIHARASAALESLGIAHLADRRVETLSGGQRQLTALAALLTLRPQLLVLDQPGLSLDPESRQRLLQLLDEHCRRGGGVLVAAPRPDEFTDFCETHRHLHAGQLSDDQPSILGSNQSARPPQPATALRVPPALPEDSTVLLEATQLGVKRGSTRIFNQLDLALRAGEVVTVSGANGVGKSTLLRALAGLLADHVTGEIISHQPGDVWGWVGQDPGTQLSAATVEGELERVYIPAPQDTHVRSWKPWGRRRTRRLSAHNPEMVQERQRVLDAVDLADHRHHHPYDLNAAQRKDLVIASALLLRPKVLLVDEPTLGRDEQSLQRVTRVISEFASAGGAVMVTTHDSEWATQISHRRLQLDATGLGPAR